MSVQKPSLTTMVLSDVSNNALMSALFTHFNGNSIYFTPVLDGGNPIEKGFSSGEDSFLLEPVDSNETWQVNFRRTENDRGLVMIDPGNGITDSGAVSTPPVGVSSQASGEVDYPWRMNDNFSFKDVMILEWSDSLMILVADSSATFVSYSCHIGRIHAPFNATDTANGLDGLGIFCGLPFLSETSVAESWATATTTTQQIRVGTSTWVDTVTAWLSTTGHDALVGTRPDGIVLRYLGRPIGVLNYVANFTGSSELSFERIFDASNVVQYMYFFDNAAASTQVVPWVDGVVWTPTANPSILNVQLAAGFDHIYDFDFDGTPTTDKGSGAADLTVVGTWTHAAPTVLGTAGSYENLTNLSLGNRLQTAVSAVNVTKDSDIFYEGIWEFPSSPGSGNVAMASVGQWQDLATHSFLVYRSATGYVHLWNRSFANRISATGLTSAYLASPTYIAVWWDHANLTYRLYYRKIGQSETVLSGVGVAGVGTVNELWISGQGVNISTCKMKVHMFGIKRGPLTATHRNNIYAKMGII